MISFLTRVFCTSHGLLAFYLIAHTLRGHKIEEHTHTHHSNCLLSFRWFNDCLIAFVNGGAVFYNLYEFFCFVWIFMIRFSLFCLGIWLVCTCENLFLFEHFSLLITLSTFLLFLQGNMVGRGVIEFCDGGPPVRINLTTYMILPHLFFFLEHTLVIYSGKPSADAHVWTLVGCPVY